MNTRLNIFTNYLIFDINSILSTIAAGRYHITDMCLFIFINNINVTVYNL